MLLLGKVSVCDATFDIDSGAHISLVSKDLEYVSDMFTGNITIKSVLGQSQTLPCAGLNVAINGMSKYYSLDLSNGPTKSNACFTKHSVIKSGFCKGGLKVFCFDLI